MVALPKIPAFMTVSEFLAWDSPGPARWQLVEGEPQAMAPASRSHNSIQAELGRLVGNALLDRGSPCTVVPTPGLIPRVRSTTNFRIPDLVVTCSGYTTEEHAIGDPVLIVEILSPSNKAETWTNVWAYVTIPSVQEILIVKSTEIGAELLRRGPDGSWPPEPEAIEADETLVLESIFSCPLRALYRTTRLARS